MNSIFKFAFIAGLTFLVAAEVAYGQSQAPKTGTNDPGVQQRMQNQESRIDQGVKSGQLTPKEAGKLEAEQAKIQQTEQRMKSDGQLTPKEREKLHNMQDRSSRHIYNQKHDAQSANVGRNAGGAPGSMKDPRIQRRMQNMERRIDQGVASGALTPKEAGKLEAEQARIKQTESRMKSDGNLTPKERQKLDNMQDRSSNHIYRQKHDRHKVNTR
jgi:hypothetical protein